MSPNTKEIKIGLDNDGLATIRQYEEANKSTQTSLEGQNVDGNSSIDSHYNSSTEADADEDDGDLYGRDIPETSPAFRSKRSSSGV